MDDLWRQPFELAWQSLKLGSFPVGATLRNSAGQVILAGRNRAAEQSAPPGHLFGTTLAHGELDVLGQLEPDPLGDSRTRAAMCGRQDPRLRLDG